MHRPRTRRSIPPQYVIPPLDVRPVSDMADELLARVISGLRLAVALSERDESILYHYLFGRSCAAIGERFGVRETTIHKYLHRVFARTQTNTRRELLHYGLLLDKQSARWRQAQVAVAPAARLAA